MRSCAEKCVSCETSCEEKECKFWIKYGDDNNCALIAIEKHGAMTLREVGDRLGVSFVRIKQIEDKSKQKLFKRMLNGGFTSETILPDDRDLY
jgi:DNA-directed RNA polymerase specialized sigma subunit